MGLKDKSNTMKIEKLKSFDESDDELSVIDEDAPPSRIYGKRTNFKNRCVRGCLGRGHMFYRGHVHPFNSGLLAGEALTSPFFGVDVPAPAPSASTTDVLAYKK